jgi:glycosyltransferase involved in cell wall biosynthesis
MSQVFRFERPDDLNILEETKLSVAVVISCRGGQDKLDLTLSSIAAQSYPSRLINVYIVDDGSEPALNLPKIRPAKTKIINYKNDPKKWGKTKATNAVTAGLKEDVFWFVDADMVFDPDHLEHHMKWHHDGDDYAVLGWKRFVKEWSYSPAELKKSLDNSEFLDLHEEHWGKELWETRSEKTNDLRNPGIEGFRNFVGATFSITNKNWKLLSGYNPDLVTGEDVELGYRIQQAGLRTVADRQALSWHLGYSTYEKYAEELKRHNDPALAQYIAEQRTTRERSIHRFKVSTYEVVVDARSCTLKQFLDHKAELLSLSGTQAEFILLGNWSDLTKRYSPTQDQFADLREIHAWLKGDSQFRFQELSSDAHLKIEEILDLYSNSSTPIRLFVEGDFKLSLKDLVSHLRLTEMGLLGLVNEKDKRAFAVLNSALARARRTKGDTYQNISEQFGAHWMIFNDNYEKSYRRISAESGIKHTVPARAKRYLRRELRKINSPKQLLIFVNKSLKIIKNRLLSNGR